MKKIKTNNMYLGINSFASLFKKTSPILFIITCIAFLFSTAHAVTITVNADSGVIAEDGECSISEAIMAANTDAVVSAMPGECIAGSGADLIILTRDVILSEVISSDQGQNGTPVINSTMTLNGNGYFLQRDEALPCVIDFVQAPDEFRLINIGTGADISLLNNIFRNGCSNGNRGGGAVFNQGNILLISNSQFIENSAREGGAIRNHGNGTITTIQNSSFKANSASQYGAGINSLGPISILINNSFIDNSVGSTFPGEGGGIRTSSNITVIENNTFSGNVARFGGAISNTDCCAANPIIDRIVNNTFTGNTATGEGAAIHQGFGVQGGHGTIYDFSNNIITNSNGSDCFIAQNGAINGSDIIGNNNLVDGGSCWSATSIAAVTNFDLTAKDNGCLSPLADGSCVMTHALMPGSNALNASVMGTATDQRDIAAEGVRDIGAFELQSGIGIIGIAKSANVIAQQVIFDYYLENLGATMLNNINLSEDLDAIFGIGNYSINSTLSLVAGTGTVIFNSGFNGSGDTTIFISASIPMGSLTIVRLVVDVTNVTDQGSGVGIYSTQNSVSARIPGSVSLSNDLSDAGTDPDPDGNGDPTNAGENDPTIFSVSQLPVFTHVFNPNTINIGGNSQLQYSIDNMAGIIAYTSLAFNNDFPTGLTVAAVPNISNTCGGTLSAIGTNVSLSGGSIPAGASCLISVDVTASQAGMLVNITDELTSSTSNIGTATDTLTVLAAVGGIVSGLAAGNSVILQNNVSDNLTVSANGSFAFASTLAVGANYAVTVLTQPNTPNQICTASNTVGIIGSSNISDVMINCITTTYSIGGNISGLAAGNDVVIQNNANDDLTVTTNGSFIFPTALADESSYVVSVLTQPSSPNQVCSLSNANGVLAGGNITNVTINCSTNTYTIGGTVSGLAPTNNVTLQNNAGDNLEITGNGAFTFATALADESPYVVSVLTQPSSPNQVCSITNANGTLAGGNVTDVMLVCVTTTYTIGGNVTGLAAGNSIVLQNNAGDNLIVPANGMFNFATALDDESSYAVTVFTQPSSPNQICSITNANGTLAGGNVTDVMLVCEITTYAIGGNVTGLAADNSVTLQNNGGDDLLVSADGAFTFATALDDGSAYVVTISTQPERQNCIVSNGSGNLSGSNIINVSILCTDITVSLSNISISFGSLFTGTNLSENVILTNTGSADVIITDINYLSDPFSISGGSCTLLPVTLPVAASCDIEVTFHPFFEGTFNDSFEVISNANSSPDVVSLSGSASILVIPTLNLWGLMLLILIFMIVIFKRRKELI